MTTDPTTTPPPSRDADALIDELTGLIAEAPEMLQHITQAISRAARLIHARRQLDNMPEVPEP